MHYWHRYTGRLLSSLLICSLATTMAASAKNSFKSYEIENQVYKLSAQGEDLYRQGNYAGAQELLHQAASFDPTSYSGRVHLTLAQCAQKLKNNNQAVTEAKAAYNFDSAQTYALYALALTYNNMNKFDSCLATLDQYMRVADPAGRAQAKEFAGRVKSYSCTKEAVAKLKSGQVKEAIKLLEIAATADPSANSACIHGNLCFAYRTNGQLERSIAEGNKALQFDQRDASIIYNIAIAYQDLAKFDDSISWLRRYLLVESDASARAQAEQLISELLDDRNKLNDADNKLPDYLKLLEKNNHVLTWPVEKLPLRIFIEPKAVPGYRPVFRNYVLKALDTWCQASGKKISYIIVKKENLANLKVRWTSDPIAATSESRQVAGLTEISRTGGHLTEAVVSLRTTDPFAPGFVENGEMASVTMHEIGHALGLDHSNYLYDVMYFRSISKQSGLPTRRDQATLARLYSNHPAAAFTPSAETGPPVVFLPPPTFAPPKPPSSEKLIPPMFMPPPLNAIKEKLMPPLFIPPPISTGKKKAIESPPFFVPPPAKP